MLTVYNLKTHDLIKSHFESLFLILQDSDHDHKFDRISSERLNVQLSGMLDQNGVILKATYGSAAAGILIATKNNSNEFSVKEFYLDADAEVRVADLLFEQMLKHIQRQPDFNAKFSSEIYCDSDWLTTVASDKIRNRFIVQAK